MYVVKLLTVLFRTIICLVVYLLSFLRFAETLYFAKNVYSENSILRKDVT